MNPTPITSATVKKSVPARPRDAHKGRNGHVLIVAGSRGMAGAPVLCALGALRAGAGLVSIAVPASESPIVASQLPEALTVGLPENPDGMISEGAPDVLERYLIAHTVNVLAVGPGLGVHAQTAHAVRGILDEFDLPLVLDADGLNNVRPDDLKVHEQLVITPHPVELGRLLNVDRAPIRQDRAGFALRTAKELEAICVLKGFQTVVSDGRVSRINKTGNPALAAGGMGDVLTGAIAALIAQGLSRFDAACAGVYLHGLAADLSRRSDRGLLAREVADALPLALQKSGVR